MKLTAKPLAVIVFVLMFGGIALSAALNWWNTSSTKTPARFREGAQAGEYNPADIRGSYKLGEIADLFDIPLEDLSAAFLLPEGVDAAAFQVKSLETQFAGAELEIGTNSVRMFTAFYKGLPFDLSGNVYLPEQAARIIKLKGQASAEQLAYLETHTAWLDGAPEPAPKPGHTAVPGAIVGKTTFQDLLTWGVSQQAIEKVLGGPMPPPATIIKDYAASRGLEFSQLKNALQVEIDNAAR